MSKVMMMPVPRFVATSAVKQEPDDAILSFIKDELDYDLLAEYFLEEDGAFDNVGSFSDNTSSSTAHESDLSEIVASILEPATASPVLSSVSGTSKLVYPSRALESMIPMVSSVIHPAVLGPNSVSTSVNPIIHSVAPPLKRKRAPKVPVVAAALAPQPTIPTSVDNHGKMIGRSVRTKSQAQIERRRERNKILARRTRLRKKFFFESLQKEVCDLQAENLALKALVKLNLDAETSKKILDESKAAEQLSDAVLEQCGLAPNLDKQDFNLVQSLQKSQKCFIVTDPSLTDNPIVYASDSFTDLTGFAKDDILGRNCRFLQGPETDESKISKVRAAIKMGEDVSVTLINYKADGTPFWNNLFVASLRDAENNVVNYIGVLIEVIGPEPGDPEYGKSVPEKAM